MEHKLVIPEQTEVCLPPSKKLESQLYIASVKSICSYIKLTAHVHSLKQEEVTSKSTLIFFLKFSLCLSALLLVMI